MKRSIGTRTEISEPNAPAITVKNLHKSFHLPTEQAFGLKQTIAFTASKATKNKKSSKVLISKSKKANFSVSLVATVPANPHFLKFSPAFITLKKEKSSLTAISSPLLNSASASIPNLLVAKMFI